MKDEKVSVSAWVCLALAILSSVLTHIVPPPSGLSVTGFEILGIFVSAVLLFLSWGTGWTSIAIFAALLTVDGVSVSDVTCVTLGNSTVIFLLFCFMLSACLTKSGVARRIAVWFLSNKLSRRSPWCTIIMYFAAVYVLDFFLSSATCIMIVMPILLSIFESVGIHEGSKKPLTSALLLGTVVVAQLANGANPISHAVTMQGFSLYESYTGAEMDFFEYCSVATPISLIGVIVFVLVLRFVWRPDVRALGNIDFAALEGSCGPISRREKYSVFIYLLVVLGWLLPSLTKHLFPESNLWISSLNNCLPPLLALFVMNFIRIDGAPILEWGDAVKAVNWDTMLFIASIMGLGSFMGLEQYGISNWLSGLLQPVFSGVNPYVFLLVMVAVVNVMTNFCSNAVALSIVFAVALPLSSTIYSGSLDITLVAILVTSGAQNGWATVPATPAAAVAYSSGYGDMKQVMKWGFIIMALQILLCTCLGLALSGRF